MKNLKLAKFDSNDSWWWRFYWNIQKFSHKNIHGLAEYALNCNICYKYLYLERCGWDVRGEDFIKENVSCHFNIEIELNHDFSTMFLFEGIILLFTKTEIVCFWGIELC